MCVPIAASSPSLTFLLQMQVTMELFCETAVKYSKGNMSLFDMLDSADSDPRSKGHKYASLGTVRKETKCIS